jgi:glycosyltransferase involved in cell wall biosynthesis
MNLSGLRIIFVTPWSTQSAIAGVNLSIATELKKRGVSVTVVRSEKGSLEKLEALRSDLPTLRPKDFLKLRPGIDYDMICYAVGDNWSFHGGAIELLAQKPGVVQLHDVALDNLVAGWKHWSSTKIHPRGTKTLSAGPISTVNSSVKIEADSFVDWPMSMATGGVVHADHYLGLAKAACPGLVVKLPLPVADIDVAPLQKRQPKDPLRIVTVGHVNSNKLPAEIIRAIGSSEKLRNQCHYSLLGPIENETSSKLEKLAGSLGVKLRMTGWLDEEDLLREIGESDCVLCLRHPILEGASMSAIVGLLSARPTVVCNAGFYAEIPDDLVIKIPARPDTAAIKGALETIVDEPGDMAAMATRARVHALETYTATTYANGLLDLAKAAIDVSFTVSEARVLYKETRAWGIDATDPLFNRLSNVSADLFS